MSYKSLHNEAEENFNVELKEFAHHVQETRVEFGVVHEAGEREEIQQVLSSEDDTTADWKTLVPEDNETAHTQDEDTHYNDYEEVLRIVGLGWFHVFLLAGLGVAIASDAVEILSISFILPFLRQENEFGLIGWQIGLLSAIIFLGMLFGSYIWGGISDITGRRKTLIVSLTVNGVFGTLSSLSPNFYLLLLFRFVSGMGVGGSFTIIPMYFSEFIHSSYRGPLLGVLSAFWMFGTLLCGGLALLLLPLQIVSVFSGSLQIPSWRAFLGFSATPSIVGAAVLFALPESPRFLLEVNKEIKALKVLKRVFTFNQCIARRHKPFPVKSIHLQKWTVAEQRYTSKCRITWCKNLLTVVSEIFWRSKQLFVPKLLRRTVMLMFTYFCLSLSAYGVVLWFPTYISHLQQTKIDTAFESVCNLTLANQTVQFDEEYQEQLLCNCPLTVYNNIMLVNVSISGGWMLSGGSLISSSILESSLTAVQSEDSTWVDVQMTDVLFINSNFSTSVWDGVTLHNVQFNKSWFCGVDVSGGVELLGVELNDCTVNGLHMTTSNSTAILSALQSSPNCSLSSVDGGLCSEPKEETDYFAQYMDDFIITSVGFPGTIFSVITVYYFRRSFLLCFSLAGSALFALLLLAFTSKLLSVIMLCLFSMMTSPAWNVSALLVAEVYPTALRSTAMGIHLSMARIGAIIGTFCFGVFGYAIPAIPLLLVFFLLLCAAVLSLFLPKTNRTTALS